MTILVSMTASLYSTVESMEIPCSANAYGRSALAGIGSYQKSVSRFALRPDSDRQFESPIKHRKTTVQHHLLASQGVDEVFKVPICDLNLNGRFGLCFSCVRFVGHLFPLLQEASCKFRYNRNYGIADFYCILYYSRYSFQGAQKLTGIFRFRSVFQLV